MVRHDVHLGSSVHVCNKNSLRLTAKGSACISSNSCPHVPGSQSVLDNQLSNAWIAPGSALEMKLVIRIPALGSTGEEAGLLSNIGDILKTPELWSGLGLVVETKSYEAAIDESGFRQLQIILHVRRKPPEHGLSGKKPRFPYSLKIPDADVRPPDAILTWLLDKVELSFDFSFISLRSTSAGVFFTHTGKASQDIAYYGDTIHRVTGPHLPTYLACWPAPNSSRSTHSQSTTQSEESWDSLDSDSPFPSQYSLCNYLPLSPIQARCADSKNPPHSAYISLVEAGLRTLMFNPNPPLACNAPMVPPQEQLKSLVEFCPAVFSPGYNLDVSRRACFIPMIVKGMASVLENTESPALLQKLEQLKGIHAERYHQPQMQGNSNHSDLRSIIKRFLWSNMQRGLVNPVAIRRLAYSKATRLAIRSRKSQDDPFDDLLDNAADKMDKLETDPDLWDDAELFFEDEDDGILTDEPDDEGWDDFANQHANESNIPKAHCSSVTRSWEPYNPDHDEDIDICLLLSSPMLEASQTAPKPQCSQDTDMEPQMEIIDFSSSPRPLDDDDDDDIEDITFSAPSSQTFFSRGSLTSASYTPTQCFDARHGEPTEMLIY